MMLREKKNMKMASNNNINKLVLMVKENIKLWMKMKCKRMEVSLKRKARKKMSRHKWKCNNICSLKHNNKKMSLHQEVKWAMVNMMIKRT